VVITQGAQGAVVGDESGFWSVRPPAVHAVSAVGSGDAFAAGLMLGLLRGQSLPEAAALGAACGAANAMTEKAGHLSPQVVESIRPRVRIERD
jgi:tagatose 6-phosphate kinase